MNWYWDFLAIVHFPSFFHFFITQEKPVIWSERKLNLILLTVNCFALKTWPCFISKWHCNNLPRATLALVASWLIQKETQDNITIRIEGRYVWNTKYPMFLCNLNESDNLWKDYLWWNIKWTRYLSKDTNLKVSFSTWYVPVASLIFRSLVSQPMIVNWGSSAS